MICPPCTLYEEITFLAAHLHWSLDELLDLEHADRRAFVAHATWLATSSGR